MNIPGFGRNSHTVVKVITVHDNNTLTVELPYTAPADLTHPVPYLPRLRVPIDRLYAKTMILPCDETAVYAVDDTVFMRAQEALISSQPNVIPGGIPTREFGMVYHIIGRYDPTLLPCP